MLSSKPDYVILLSKFALPPHMKGQYILKQEDFDALLLLFSEDREEAGRMYERLRNGLIRYFGTKGCSDAQELADETLNRVASKAKSFDSTLSIKPSAYVYGFASKIFLERARNSRNRELPFEPDFDRSGPDARLTGDPEEETFLCLENCLNRLSEEDRSLMVRYYSKEKQQRIELRKHLADELGCKPEVLHMKIFRLRASLRSCVKDCIKKKDG